MLRISLTDQRTTFAPGEAITGQVSWTVDSPPSKAELRLCWSTRGKGTEDSDVAVTIPYAHPQTNAQHPFTIRAPAEPYSFSGKLISLRWSLELVLEPDGFDQVELVIAPDGKAVSLPHLPSEPVKPIKFGPVTLDPEKWKAPPAQ